MELENAGQAEPLTNPLDEKIDDVLEKWFEARIHNSPYSRDTDSYNSLRQSFDEVKQEIKDAIGAA